MALKVTGTGDYTYEARHNWGEIKEGYEFGEMCGVAVDSKDRLFVFHRGDKSVNARIAPGSKALPPVVVFEADGTFIDAWGSDVIVDTHHMTIGPDDSVYLVDRDGHEVVKCTPDGEPVLRLGNRDAPSLQAPFNHPTSVGVSSTGEIFVSDGYANSRVHKFSEDGTHLKSWGSPGTGPGEFWVPHGLSVDESGRVYVADRENNRVQVFNSDGDYLTEWGDLYLPTDVFVTGGVGYVCELLTTRFTVFDTETGSMIARGRSEDQTHSICTDAQGNMYGAQIFNRSVLKYEKRNGL